MIYKCTDCVNRDWCPENKAQYEMFCGAIERLLEEDKPGGKYHCYANLSLKCDYYISDSYPMGERNTK